MTRGRVVRSRRQFLQGSVALAGLGIVSACGMVGPWTPSRARVPRLGYLTLSFFPEHLHAAFRQGLQDHGYAVGQTIVIESRVTDDPAALRQLAAELVDLKCDVLLAAGALVIQPLMDATTSIPIVSPTLGDPVGSGVVTSLGRPGGNITGLSLLTPEMSAKRLELLKDTIPGINRVGVLVNPTNPHADAEWRQTQAAGQALGLRAIPLEVRQPEDFDQAFGVALRERVEALLTLVDIIIQNQRTRIADFVAQHRLPTMYYARMAVEDGGLMAYEVVHADNFRHAATYVDKILKGAKPADLPVEQPTKFDFVINLKTAQVLGLTIPQSVLQQATEILP